MHSLPYEVNLRTKKSSLFPVQEYVYPLPSGVLIPNNLQLMILFSYIILTVSPSVLELIVAVNEVGKPHE